MKIKIKDAVKQILSTFDQVLPKHKRQWVIDVVPDTVHTQTGTLKLDVIVVKVVSMEYADELAKYCVPQWSSNLSWVGGYQVLFVEAI